MPKTNEPKNNFSELKEKFEETQKELLYLKAENEYLKGLRRLRMEQQMLENPELFTPSKDISSSH